jgi:exodeoxyribonuclease-3
LSKTLASIYTHSMKYISWNVNGIRAWKDKEGVLDFITKENADVLCLQETKIDSSKVDDISTSSEPNLFDEGSRKQTFDLYPYEYWNSAERKGYSGTALFSKTEPLSVEYGIGHELDIEGRVITAEFEDHYLVTVYTPNSKNDLSRLMLRYNEWDKQFLKHVQKLEKKKPVIFCGDLNVAHKEIDLKNDQANKTTETKPGNAGFTDQERERFEDFLSAGFLDTFRELYPDKEQYSWWSYRAFARERNVGWRIDYFLISPKLKSQLKDAIIYDQIIGSDHCPVGVVME